MFNKLSFLLTGLILSLSQMPSMGQELLCDVDVKYEEVTHTDPKVFDNMKEKVFSFLNDTAWTDDKFEEEERIDCSCFINILTDVGQNAFKAQVTIKSTRPVYNSSYNSVMLDVIDNDFEFEFDPFTVLEYRQGEFSNNLTASLAFYAYTIIGLDYDSFRLNGGKQFHEKAEDIVSQASSSKYPGWTPTKSNNKGKISKYWINNNLTDPRYGQLKRLFYQYNRDMLDQLYDNPRQSWEEMVEVMEGMYKVYDINRNLPILYIFFDAKNEEIVDIMKEAPSSQRKVVGDLAREMDPINNKKYKTLTQ